MRKLLKFILKTLILIVIIGFLFIQYLKSDFNNPFDQTRLSELKSEIENANSISADFIKVYDQINPITNTNGILFDGMKEDYYRECPCLNVARMSFIHGKSRLLGNEYVLAWKLEKEFTQEQCFDYYVKNFDFAQNHVGINSASEYYFKKELIELNFDQKATLAIMMKNPFLYNPIRNPEILKKKLSEIKTNHNNGYK